MAVKALVAIADFGGSPTVDVVKECFDLVGFTTKVFSTVKGDFIHPEWIGEDLPFTHRSFFAENKDKYDYFFYTENDIYYSRRTLELLFQNFSAFGKDQPLGLIRSERNQLIDFGAVTDRPKIKYKDDIKFYATNDHQGSYILSKDQLQRCIDSGNYSIPPSARHGYGKLETGASNVYFECGLQKAYPNKNLHLLVVDHIRPRWADKQPRYLLDDLYRDLDNQP